MILLLIAVVVIAAVVWLNTVLLLVLNVIVAIVGLSRAYDRRIQTQSCSYPIDRVTLIRNLTLAKQATANRDRHPDHDPERVEAELIADLGPRTRCARRFRYASTDQA